MARGRRMWMLMAFVVVTVVLLFVVSLGEDIDDPGFVNHKNVVRETAGPRVGASLDATSAVAAPTTTPASTTAGPAIPSMEIIARIAKWSGGALFTVAPLNDTGEIPPRLFVTWKTKSLPSRAQMLLDGWGSKEPELERVVVDDADCAWLAEWFPNLKPRYDALPMNVMRADICRLLLVYYF